MGTEWEWKAGINGNEVQFYAMSTLQTLVCLVFDKVYIRVQYIRSTIIWLISMHWAKKRIQMDNVL